MCSSGTYSVSDELARDDCIFIATRVASQWAHPIVPEQKISCRFHAGNEKQLANCSPASRQVLLDFIRTDEGRCVQIAKYFQHEIEIDTTLKVISNKGQGVAQDVAVKGRETGIQYVAHQYPGNENSGIANNFMYEFVSLHDDVNSRKERVSSVSYFTVSS